MTNDQDQPDKPSLQSRLRRGWVFFLLAWVIGSALFVTVGWDEIYPERPAYIIALDDAGEKLVVWYASDAGQSAESFVRERGLGRVDQIAVGPNTLVLPADLEPANREDLIDRARKMEIYLDERFMRGILFRFIPIVIFLILGPPLIVLLLGRALRSLMVRWLQD